MTTDTKEAGPSAGRVGFARIGGDALVRMGIKSSDEHRIQFGNLALANQGANTAAVLHGLGTSTTPVEITQGSKNFLGYWVKSSAGSGDVRGFYMRLYLSGAGGTGEAARLYATVSNVAASTVRGAHISLDFAATGTVTGLGVALECTLHIANQGTQNGTMSPIKLAIHSDGAASDPSGALLSYINIVNQGDATGDNDVDDDAFLFNITGHAAGSGTLFTTATNTTIDHALKISVGGVTYYVGLYDALA